MAEHSDDKFSGGRELGNGGGSGELGWPVELARYSRQMLMGRIGVEGQRRLKRSRVVLIGCGALGTTIAETLVRAGVGFIRIVDRDFIEVHNLQRQTLFDQGDIDDDLPKAEAAARKLRRINELVTVEPVVADATWQTVARLTEGVDLILDGTDNLGTRFLVNDISVKFGVPWVYGACVATEGRMMVILPGETPCLRCVFGEAPAAGGVDTCDTVGIIGPIARMVGSLQATQAIRILTGQVDAAATGLVTVDVWEPSMRRVNVADGRDPVCVCCGQGKYEYLDGTLSSSATGLCGRDAVQVTPAAGAGRLELGALAERLAGVADGVSASGFMVRAVVDGYVVVVFGDGRAIVKGTSDPAVARGVYDRVVGS